MINDNNSWRRNRKQKQIQRNHWSTTNKRIRKTTNDNEKSILIQHFIASIWHFSNRQNYRSTNCFYQKSHDNSQKIFNINHDYHKEIRIFSVKATRYSNYQKKNQKLFNFKMTRWHNHSKQRENLFNVQYSINQHFNWFNNKRWNVDKK